MWRRGVLPWGEAANPRPPMSAAMLGALHCWHFMGGVYRPELLPVYAGLHPVGDLEQLLELLLVIREALHG
jgi:hypothetical protein